MTSAIAVDLIREALMTTFWISMPILMVGFLIGIVISLIQIITSMQDASFSTVPRLAAFLVGLLLLLPWMLNRMISYTAILFGNLGRYGH